MTDAPADPAAPGSGPSAITTAPPASSTAPSALRFSVIVPSIGRDPGLARLLEALAAQSFPRERFEVRVALVPASCPPAARDSLASLGAELVPLERNAGPGAARNAAARGARGEFLAFTEDDCVPDRNWLAHAERRLAQERDLDVLDGATLKPGGRPVRAQPGADPLYLPTNLFVRRALFERMGGYCEDFFEGGVYFREDSDLGFTLEESGAKIARDRTVIVTHPDEHPRFGDPLRWARRYLMDPLLDRRHPERFRDRIEVMALGPLRVRRPFVRACFGFIAGLGTLVAGLAMRGSQIAWTGGALAAITLLAVWAKWRFHPRHLPVVPLVPFVLVGALIAGERRAARIAARSLRT
jgi:glycosyltransferase involved in cell wall biosynthesis